MSKEDVFDQVDREIVAILENNCRLPASSVAQQLNITPAKVASRIQNMLDRGIIKFTTQHNLRAFGYDHFAVVQLTIQGGFRQEVAARIAAVENVIIAVEALGAPHIFAYAVARSPETLRHVIFSDLAAIPGIICCEATSVVDTVRFATNIASLEQHGHLWIPSSGDEMDDMIIAALQSDARTGNAEIARQLGTSEASVRQRIRKMTNDNRIRFGIITEQRFLTVNAILLRICVAPAQLKAITETLSHWLPWIMVTEGRYQIVAALHGTDILEVNTLLLEKIETLPGIIRTNAQLLLQIFKHNYNCIVLPD